MMSSLAHIHSKPSSEIEYQNHILLVEHTQKKKKKATLLELNAHLMQIVILSFYTLKLKDDIPFP